jgi:MerR family transcriptional regulator, repressor of the yfmOP operon
VSPVRSSPSPPGAAAPARVAAGPGRPAAPAPGPPAGPAAGERLLGISEAAARAGVSARALRYYQQIGLLVPARTTPGGMRRYSADDLTRVARIRELQSLLGLNLEEIALVLRNEDRLAEIRLTYRDERTSDAERRALLRECLALQQDLRDTVRAKRDALTGFLADLDARIGKAQGLLAAGGTPPA